MPGCVLAAVDGDQAGVFPAGLRDLDPQLPWENDTIFGLESVTKVFTAIMLAHAVDSGLLNEQSFIDGYLPPDTTLPQPIERKITLRILANYTSQLPNLPSNFPRTNHKPDPAQYTLAEFRYYLEHLFHPDPQAIGTKYLYSSLAFGLLGDILTNAHGLADYQDLVAQQLTEPLGMADTVVSPSPARQPRVAIGYDGAQPQPQPPLATAPFLGGGGALRSTGDDMLRFLRALATRAAPRRGLVRAIEHTEAKTFDLRPARAIGLGWFISEGEAPYFIKNGAGSGFYALIAYAPARRVGLFAAANRVVEGVFETEFASLLGSVQADELARA